MRFRFEIDAGRRRVAIFGSAGLLALLAILFAPSLLAPSLDAGRARQEVLKYLRQQLGAAQLTELRSSKLAVPDSAMSARWQGQQSQIDGLEFVSVEVGRLPYLPFSSSRMFMIKAVLKDTDGGQYDRYFSMSARSRLYDFFWVAEQSRLLWLLAF